MKANVRKVTEEYPVGPGVYFTETIRAPKCWEARLLAGLNCYQIGQLTKYGHVVEGPVEFVTREIGVKRRYAC